MATKRKPIDAIRYSGANRVWTERELTTLRAMVGDGLAWDIIAKTLDRTEKAVRDRAGRRHLIPKPDTIWTEAETATLESMCSAGKSWKLIARTIGRTVKACQSRWGFASTTGPASVYKENYALSEETNRDYVIACMQELEARNAREFVRAYRTRCELDIPPGTPDRVMVFYADVRSTVGSQAAMCAGA